MERDIEKCMGTVRDWAKAKVDTGREPPWAWYQYMKLIDAVDALLPGGANVRRLEADSRPPRDPVSSPRGSKEIDDQKGSEQPPVDETD